MSFSLHDNYIIVNYHYVRNPESDFSGIHPCSISEFERQISFLSCHFTSVTIPELFRAAKERRKGKFYTVTFDDGQNDQYQNAAPLLKKYNAHATFFIITKTMEGFFPFTHKLHLILSRFLTQELINDYNSFLAYWYPKHTSQYAIPVDSRLTLMRRMHDDIPTANLKEMIHNILPWKEKEHFVNTLFSRLDFNEAEMANTFFMSRTAVAALHKSGFSIGNHTHSHTPLNRQTETEIQEELHFSQKYLEEITGETPVLFCYPQSHNRESAEKIANILQKTGFSHAVTIEERAIQDSDRSFTIPRYDTNNIRDFLDKKSPFAKQKVT